MLAVIADDLTGACDCGIQLVRAGYRTAVAFHGTPVPPVEDIDAVAVDTDSRALPPNEARERVIGAVRAAGEASILYKKLDSTLRGPIAAELGAALEASGRQCGILAPAFPATGRFTRSGVQVVHDTPVHRTEIGEDPYFHASESHIPTLLAGAGLGPVIALSVADLRDANSVREAIEQSQWIVADAEQDDDLEALARAVPDPSAVLWSGSAGLAWALGAVHPGPRAAERQHERQPVGRVLVVAGSRSSVTREQLRVLSGEEGVDLIPLESAAAVGEGRTEAVGRAAAQAQDALGQGNSAALYSTPDNVSGSSKDVVDALAEVVAKLAEERLFDGLILTGGETAVSVACRIGDRGILLEAELEPGIPVGTLIGSRPYPVVTKAGAFGGPDALRKAFHALTYAGKDLQP